MKNERHRKINAQQFNINYTRIEVMNEQYGSHSAASRS